jgi:hypothetical protein
MACFKALLRNLPKGAAETQTHTSVSVASFLNLPNTKKSTNHSNRANWFIGQCFWRVYLGCPVRISAGTPAILIEIIRGFPQSFQGNVKRVPYITPRHFLVHSVQFIIYYHPTIRSYIFWVTDGVVKQIINKYTKLITGSRGSVYFLLKAWRLYIHDCTISLMLLTSLPGYTISQVSDSRTFLVTGILFYAQWLDDWGTITGNYRKGQDFLLHTTGSWIHSASYPVGTTKFFPGSKVTRA